MKFNSAVKLEPFLCQRLFLFGKLFQIIYTDNFKKSHNKTLMEELFMSQTAVPNKGPLFKSNKRQLIKS